MKFKKLSDREKINIERRIKLLLCAGLDYCQNTNNDRTFWFSPNNPYTAEAFGVLHALEVLGYGYFGPDNSESLDPHNLKCVFDHLKHEVAELGDKLGPKEAYHYFKDLK